MKSILYVGATLMIGASIYGFVDYNKTSHQKEFTSMYEEEKKTTPVVMAEDKITEPAVTKGIAENNKKVVTKKQFTGKDETISVIKTITEAEMMAAKVIKKIKKSSGDVKTSKDSGLEKKVKKKKKLNHHLFSRAPLRDKEEINLVQPLKTEMKKTEIKEQ